MIELMVSVGILSFIMLALMTATEHAMMVSQTADARANLTSIVSSTAGQAFNNVTCTAAITRTPQSYGTPLQFDTIRAGADLPAYNLTVKNLVYQNPTLVQTGQDGTKVYYGILTMVATSKRIIYGGQTFAPRTIAAVYFTVNPAGTITNCGPIAPTLTSTPAVPPPTDDAAIRAACASAGGTMSGGTCTFSQGRGGDGHGNGRD